MVGNVSLEELQNASDTETATILLSTFNGERHLEEQLRSFDRQSYRNIHVIVRDDGSRDGTISILKEWAHATSLKTAIVVEENCGARDSFFRLLQWAPSLGTALFSDQDDVWHPDKVARAVERLGRSGGRRPELYCSRLNLVDKTLQRVGKSPLWPQAPSFENALVENIATGCTCAMNSAAVDVFRNSPKVQNAIMHDWWIYLGVSAVGTVIYDPEPRIDYRVHANNVVGLPTSKVSWTFSKLKRQLAAPILPKLVRQAEEFETIFSDRLSASQLDAIATLANCHSLSGAMYYARQSRVHRQFAGDDRALKAMITIAALKDRWRRHS